MKNSAVKSKLVLKKNTFIQRLWRIKALFRPPVLLSEISVEIAIYRDIKIPMRDSAELCANIYRPKFAGKFPALLSLHPYGKDNLPQLGKVPFQYRVIRQTGKINFSNETSWEAPDPDFWVQHGYVVINIDKRGFGHSSGEQEFFDDQEANDYYDAIEWAAVQDWCIGKVGLLGVSYLAVSQYKAAALQPPHLTAICPWEGFSDLYKDAFRPGGIREDGFINVWSGGVVKPFGLNFKSEQTQRVTRDKFYLATVPELKKIIVPALICASFSDQLLHTRGSFRAFETISSPHKWLYTHRSGKWDAFYSLEAKMFQLRFFDYFLKGIENSMLDVAPIRLEVRDAGDKIHQIRYEDSWPLAKINWVPLSLDINNASLNTRTVLDDSKVSFNLVSESLQFDHKFIDDCELIGTMKLCLFMSLSNCNDANLFIGIQKLHDGNEISFEGSYGFANDVVTKGFMRVSLSQLNSNLSTAYYPEHDFNQLQNIPEGQIVKLEISLLQSATYFCAGDELRLVIQGRSLLNKHKLDQIGAYEDCSAGSCSIYSSSEYPSQLIIPLVN